MELLFEIGMEEIPARFLKQSLKDLKNNLEKNLKENRIKYDDIKTYGTPRRLILTINNLSEKQEELNTESIGPSKEVSYKDGVLTKAGLGFIKSHGAEEKDIKIVKTDKGEYIFINKYSKGSETKKLLPEILKKMVLDLSFPKSMRWSDKNLRFARPIEWILALYGNEVVDFEIEGIKTSNKSKGHRFFGEEFSVNNSKEYFEKIKENNVIVDIEERKEMIRDMIKNSLEETEQVVIEDNLLDEVTNLIEYPFPIVGTFNPEYLEVPQEVLIISMQVHQRYFPVLDKNGKLLSKFIVIRNGIEYSENVKKGNEKVLSARLADARFFYKEDLKISLDSNVEKLKNVVFQKDLGTIYSKIKRCENIAKFLIEKLSFEDKEEDILRTVKLAKADLVTNMIGEKEFTKLQGFMGADYALKLGEKDNVSLGIKEHYYPRFQGDLLPSGIEGIITGISDRIDTLVGCFGVGLIPTGSKDPYALRRSALGIVNIIISSGLNISLQNLVEISLNELEKDGVLKEDKEKTKMEVLEFLKQRILNVLSDMKYKKDVINAVVEKNFDNVVECQNKIKSIEEYLNNEKFLNLLQATKRIENICKNNKEIKVNEKLFKTDYEKDLCLKSFELEKKSDELILNKEYREYIETLFEIIPYINSYFENVIVMDEDLDIRLNRVNQLTFISNIFNKIAYLKNID